MNKNFDYIDDIDVKQLEFTIQNIDNDEWDKNDYRQKTFPMHNDTKTLFVMWSDLGDEKVFTGESNPKHLSLYKKFEKDIEIIEKKLYKNFDGGRIIRLIAVKLPGGGYIDTHKDFGKQLESGHRIHIPVITNESVLFTIGNETINMKQGEIWEINNQEEHSVVNDSIFDRIHLIIDWIKNDN